VEADVGFERVRSAWQQLGPNARYFTQTPEWIELLAARLDGDVAWGALVVDGRPAAVAVLRRSVRRAAGVKLRILSRIRAGEAHHLAAEGLLDREAFGAHRLRDLLDVCGPWDVMWLVELRAGSPWLELAGAQELVRAEPHGGAGVLDTRPPFGQRWSAVPKNMRNSIRKARGRLDANGGAEIVVARGAEIAAAYERFVELEASGWKAHRAGALADMPHDRGLNGDYLRSCATAQVRSLNLDGRMIAGQLAVTTARTLFLTKIAYDETFAELSPSNVLMAELIEACCEDPAIDRIDCLEWHPWHPRWGMVREPTYSLIAFNRRSLRGLAARAARGGWELANRASTRGSALRPTRRGSERVDA
jgi:CelD/BcsL family acetyltransferase involved in cellulose biosynthesis